MSATVTVRTSGPLFDGRFDAALDAYTNAAADDIADHGLTMMHHTSRSFRNPTGQWENHLVVDRVSDDRVITNDLVYNAWLEGVGSRNKTTRFKGYRMWRLTTQRLNDLAPLIAERTLRRFIGRMN